jgi:hypothetical protein
MTKPKQSGGTINDLSAAELYAQNWEHVRHVENERLGFTSVYFVILAAILAFLSQTHPTQFFSVALFFLVFLLSAIGSLMSIRLKADMEAHGDRLRKIANNSRYPEYFTFGAETGWTTRIKLRILFPAIYTILALMFLALAIASIINPELLATILPPNL